MSGLRPVQIWLALMALTLASTIVAEQVGSAHFAIVAIFLVAAAKAELVMANYMETRRAGGPWRILYRSWVAVVAVMLTAGHLAG